MKIQGIELAHAIVGTLEEKKGEDILLLDIGAVCSFTDYFVICTGGSERTLNALATEVQRRLRKEHRVRVGHVEGDALSGWVLLDYGDVVLHIFSPELRKYYRLEELWQDGQVVVHLR